MIRQLSHVVQGNGWGLAIRGNRVGRETNKQEARMIHNLGM